MLQVGSISPVSTRNFGKSPKTKANGYLYPLAFPHTLLKDICFYSSSVEGLSDFLRAPFTWDMGGVILVPMTRMG